MNEEKNHGFILDRNEVARGNISRYFANYVSVFKSQDNIIYKLLAIEGVSIE